MTVSGIKSEGEREGRREEGREGGRKDLSHQWTCDSPLALFGRSPVKELMITGINGM